MNYDVLILGGGPGGLSSTYNYSSIYKTSITCLKKSKTFIDLFT
jgi:flavin-dependent dehydrogenase